MRGHVRFGASGLLLFDLFPFFIAIMSERSRAFHLVCAIIELLDESLKNALNCFALQTVERDNANSYQLIY